MPYLKFSRDRRGYEHFSIVEPGHARRGKPPRPRVLFFFRTPPQIKVGRTPFTDEVRRAIEAQNPGVRFDWPRLLATPIPPPDAEHWRERRRAEKAARQAAREAEGLDREPASEAALSQQDDDAASLSPGEIGPEDAAADVPGDEAAGVPGENVPAGTVVQASESAEPPAPAQAVSGDAPAGGGRRRRRRSRRRRRHTAEATTDQVPPASGTPTEEV